MKFIVRELVTGRTFAEFEADRVERLSAFTLVFYRRTRHRVFGRWLCIGVVETPSYFTCTPAADDATILRELGVKL